METAIKTKTICLSMSAAFLRGNVQVNQSAYRMFWPFGKHMVLVPPHNGVSTRSFARRPHARRALARHQSCGCISVDRRYRHGPFFFAWCAAHAACMSPVSERHWLQAIARESVGARQHLGDPPGRLCPGSFEFTIVIEQAESRNAFSSWPEVVMNGPASRHAFASEPGRAGTGCGRQGA